VMPAGWIFVSASILIRVVSAISNAAVITSSFAFISIDFPHSIAKIFSLTRIMMNVGQLAGPALGGAIYELGGYSLPFITLGVLQCIVALVSLAVMPTYDNFLGTPKKGQGGANNDRHITVTKMIFIPGMWVAFTVFLVSTISNGFVSVTLEPCVLRKFELTPFYMGMLFGIKDGANSIFSPFWGWICDRKSWVRPGIIACCVMAALSFILVGPAPGLNIPLEMGIIIFAMFINGVAIGGQQVAGVVDALNEAIDAGYPDDPSTHGCVSGMWSSVSGLGRFLARTASGFLVDDFGFPVAAMIVVAIQVFVGCLTVFFIFYKRASERAIADSGDSMPKYVVVSEPTPNVASGPQNIYNSLADDSTYPRIVHSKEFHLSQSISTFM